MDEPLPRKRNRPGNFIAEISRLRQNAGGNEHPRLEGRRGMVSKLSLWTLVLTLSAVTPLSGQFEMTD